MNTFSSIENLLLKNINQMEEHKEDFVKRPFKDFSRKSKLSFKDTILALISMEQSSLKYELQKFFNYSSDTPTTSAFIQQRDKLKKDTFKHLFYSFSKELPTETMNGFHILSIDGSDVLIPLEKEDKRYSYFRREDQSCYHQMHLNAIYDVITEMFVTVNLEPRLGHDERRAFHEMFEHHSFCENSIFVFDRGYESYSIMAHISSKNQYFLIRAKDWNSGGILKGIPKPDAEEFDFIWDKTFVPQLLAKHRKEPEKYHVVHFSDSPYFLNREVKEYPLSFRVVRLKLDNGSYESLLTNLPAEKFDIKALKKLYHMRWCIETSFRQLKFSAGLLDFHSKKMDAIEIEIWARLILYNFTMAVSNSLEKRKSKSRYLQKLNITNAIHICRRFLKTYVDASYGNADDLISRELLPIRPDRSSPRKKHFQRPHKFNYRS